MPYGTGICDLSQCMALGHLVVSEQWAEKAMACSLGPVSKIASNNINSEKGLPWTDYLRSFFLRSHRKKWENGASRTFKKWGNGASRTFLFLASCGRKMVINPSGLSQWLRKAGFSASGVLLWWRFPEGAPVIPLVVRSRVSYIFLQPKSITIFWDDYQHWRMIEVDFPLLLEALVYD